MHKNTIWYAAVLLVLYLTLVFCEEADNNTETQIPDTESLLSASSRDLLEVEEGRIRRHRHHMFYRHLWPLAIAYWIKVKVVIVSFFVGSAIFLGLKYFWPHKCHSEIILDHPPPSFDHHHDHIPYSFDHSEHSEHYDSIPTSFDSSSFEPYSGYSGYSAGSDIVSDVSDVQSGPTAPSSDIHRLGKRSVAANADDEEEQVEELEEAVDEEVSESVARAMPAEEQIADFMFAFLGLDSMACRRRFVCEMEFRSKLNPMTDMAFRIVGRGFFEKYTNEHNPQSRANDFTTCAAVNPECVFIENNEGAEPVAISELTTEENAETNSVESENEQNLLAERRHAKLKSRRGDRMLSSIADFILKQTQQ